MKSPVAFYALLKAEYFKAKRNSGVLVLLLFPIAITVLTNIYVLYDSVNHQGSMSVNPWIYTIGRYSFSFYAFLYPLIVAIACHSLCDMEYRNQSFKQLFTLPISKKNIYLVKVIYLSELIFLSVLIAYASFLVSGWLMSYILPGYRFQDYDVRLIAGVFFFKTFIGALAIAFMQYYLSMLFKSFVISMGAACFLTIFSLVANRWAYIVFIPHYSIFNTYNGFMRETISFFSKVEFINIGYIVIFLFLLYFLFKRQRSI